MEKKRLKILAAAMLFLLFLAYGCKPETKSNVNAETKSNVNDHAQATPQKPKIIPQSELKRMALNVQDTNNLTLRNKYEFYKQTGDKNSSLGYFITFDDNKRPSDKMLTNRILTFSSKEEIDSYMGELREEFVKNFPKNYNEVSIKKIGDSSSSYGAKFFGRDITSVWFSKYNAVVAIQLEGGSVEEAVSYAKKIEAKLDKWDDKWQNP